MRLWLIVAGVACAMTVPALSQEVPVNIRSVIEKTQSFGLGKYPISFWSYTNLREHGQHMNRDEVAQWADAGFTVPQSPTFDPQDPDQVAQMRSLLDYAQESGMKLIICDPRTYARRGPDGDAAADYADGVREAVAMFGDHPATFGFHVGDEPGKDDNRAFFSCYRTQKEIAPNLHPFGNLLPNFPGAEQRVGAPDWPTYLDRFAHESNADLISYDYYAQMNPGEGGWQGYYDNLRLYREASWRNGIPFWNTVLSVGHFRYRVPNYDEVRWQFNTTVASGAHGVLWFFYYMRQPHANYRLSPVDENWNRTETYDSIRRVHKDFHRHYGDLFTRLCATRVTFYPKAMGRGEVFTPNGIVSAISPDINDHPILIGEFTDLQGRRYVMIVNNSMKDDVNVGVTFPGKDVRVFSWDWYGREHEGGAYCADGQERNDDGLTIRHWLAPGQEAVYRVESESAQREPMPNG